MCSYVRYKDEDKNLNLSDLRWPLQLHMDTPLLLVILSCSTLHVREGLKKRVKLGLLAEVGGAGGLRGVQA